MDTNVIYNLKSCSNKMKPIKTKRKRRSKKPKSGNKLRLRSNNRLGAKRTPRQTPGVSRRDELSSDNSELSRFNSARSRDSEFERDAQDFEDRDLHRENLQHMNLLDLPEGTPRNDHFAIIKNNVQNYLRKKSAPELYSREFQEMTEFIKYMYSIKDNEFNKDFNCDQCWIDFLRGASFTRYLLGAGTKRDVFYITPNQDNESMTFKNDLPEGDYLSFNIQKEFIALILKDVVMFDFDFKDGADEEVVMKQFQKIVEIGKEAFNIDFTFIVFKSDAGVHVFLLSHKMRHDDLQTIDFMLSLCNDIWYCAFSHINGFGIRLNPKKDRPDDFIADPGGRVKKAQGDRLLDELLVDPDDDYMVKKMSVLDKSPLIEVLGDDLSERRFEDMPFIEIQSEYYRKNIKLNYIDSDFSESIDSIVFIGDVSNVDNDVYKRVMKHFIYIQYFKPIKGERSKNFMCHIGDILLNLDDENNEVKRVRNDLRKIDEELDRIYNL